MTTWGSNIAVLCIDSNVGTCELVISVTGMPTAVTWCTVQGAYSALGLIREMSSRLNCELVCKATASTNQLEKPAFWFWDLWETACVSSMTDARSGTETFPGPGLGLQHADGYSSLSATSNQ